MFPEPHYGRRILRRAFLFWLGLRTALLLMALALRMDPLLPLTAVVMVAVLVAVMCAVDARFMRESLFYANLGVASWLPAAAGCAVALGGEIVIAMVLRVLA